MPICRLFVSVSAQFVILTNPAIQWSMSKVLPYFFGRGIVWTDKLVWIHLKKN